MYYILQYLYKVKVNVILNAYAINYINNYYFYEYEKNICREKCVVISMFTLWRLVSLYAHVIIISLTQSVKKYTSKNEIQRLKVSKTRLSKHTY